MKKTISYIVLYSCLFMSVSSTAKGVYLEPKEFLNNVFDHEPPHPKTLWFKKNLRPIVKEIMGHDLNVIRLRYWAKDDKTTWILEEIGRDKPITVGLVVQNSQLVQVNVLIFRESRGWEIKYPFFTDQFTHATLVEGYQLDRKIDGISGATLSVNALTKLARLALFLDSYVKN